MVGNSSVADFRSDTVTKPSEGMRKAVYMAEVGDDVLGDDPTVKKLEKKISEMTGMDDAVFVSSGTQSNLLGIMSHCERGDEYIAGQTAHCYNHEGGGAAVLGSIQPQPVEFLPDGSLDLDEVSSKIKPDDFHFARTRLLCLENTQDGKVLSQEYLEKAVSFCFDKKLSLHLDGARIFNASVSQGIDVSDVCRDFDTVSVCLSKGLGAPVGSLLCGAEDRIKKARRWRKVLGGGMRQSGMIAAAGLYALENNIERLAEDHENAALLKEKLSGIDELEIVSADTNMVFVRMLKGSSELLAEDLLSDGIIILPGDVIRFVTHLDISTGDIVRTSEAIKKYFIKPR